MKKRLAVFLAGVVFCLGLMGCNTENQDQTAACGHEKYLPLIDSLEAEDFAAARRIIDAMDGNVAAATESTAGEAEPITVTQPLHQPETSGGQRIELDIRNFMDYFEIREDLIFEDPVKCYQSIQLREEYRNAYIQNVNVEVSYFDSHAYGELDHEDQLFFPEYYDMVTGELALREVAIGNNGEGFLSLGSYSGGCFQDYLMDIAITDVTGSLILKAG